jgi:hypothetical protein
MVLRFCFDALERSERFETQLRMIGVAQACLKSNARRWIKSSSEAADGFGRWGILDKFGNRSAQLLVAHRRGRGAQRANAEAADNLVIVTVMFFWDEFADASQQGRDRHLNLPGACWRMLPIEPSTEKPRQHAVMPDGVFHAFTSCKVAALAR